MSRKSEAGGCGLISFAVFAIFCAVMGNWTAINLSWVLTEVFNKPVDVPLWLGVVLSIFTNVFGFTFNIIVDIIQWIV